MRKNPQYVDDEIERQMQEFLLIDKKKYSEKNWLKKSLLWLCLLEPDMDNPLWMLRRLRDVDLPEGEK